jgi:hypothetical protein
MSIYSVLNFEIEIFLNQYLKLPSSTRGKFFLLCRRVHDDVGMSRIVIVRMQRLTNVAFIMKTPERQSGTLPCLREDGGQ